MSKFELDQFLRKWDTQFFGFPVYQINLSQLSKFNLDIYDLVTAQKSFWYLFSEIEIPNFYKNLMDVKITYSKKTSKESSIKKKTNLNFFQKTEKNEMDLIALSIEAGMHSRFKRDVMLQKKFLEMYTIWAKKSIDGSMADYILVETKNEHITGFVSVLTKNDFLEIGLIAVDKMQRGRGIGEKLLRQVEFLAINLNSERVEVPTQEINRGACNFYIKNGFTQRKKEFIYHFNSL